MAKDRILLVEYDVKTAEYLKSYFDWQGYEVLTASSGNHALATCRLKLPNVVILDIVLPDINGFEICRVLRKNSRTSHIPIIFLTHRNKRSDIIFAFEVGADDYIIKPFDLEELKLRVEGAIRYSRRGVLRHPVTNLPAGELIIEQLKAIKDSVEPWTLLYLNIRHFDVFKAVSDSNSVNKFLINFADLLREAVERHGAQHDFIGQASDDGFVVITMPEAAGDICRTVEEQFQPEKMTVAQAIGLLKLAVHAVSSYDGPFTDIRQITETLAKLWVNQQESGWPDETYGLHSQAANSTFCNQLSEQVSLWQRTPLLAQALIEVERLIATKLPDMNKIKVLLDLADETYLMPQIVNRLQNQYQLCDLTCQNLDELQYKIRSYQKSDPAPLIETLQDTVQLLQKPRLKVSVTTKDTSEVMVSLPRRKLQQAIYNVCKWLLGDEHKANLVIAVDTTATGTSLRLALANSERHPSDPSNILEMLDQNFAGAVYGYLAQKIVGRYGGTLEADGNRLCLKLPSAEKQADRLSQVDSEKLRQKIREQRLFLDKQNRASSTPIFEKAADLIDPLAEDLLGEIEIMLVTLNTHSGIDTNAYPWSAIQRYCHLSRLLALELRKNRPLIPAPINLKSLLESIRPLLAHRVLKHDIIIESEVARPVVNTDKTRLSQIFVSLALNALEAMPEEGVLKFQIKQEGSHFIVNVIDNGRGISSESQSFIFDPHFTTKGTGRGLGLHNVRTYVEQLHGQIHVASQIGKGTTVTVKLPPNWGAGYF